MSAKAASKPKSTAPAEQGERTYLFLGLAALLLLLAVLLERGARERALFPVLLGLAGLVLRWRFTPVLFLVVLAGVLMQDLLGAFFSMALRPFGHSGPLVRGQPLRTLATTLSDLALCIAVLAFLVACYRLQGLTVSIFPRDPRRRSASGGPALDRTRPDRLVTPAELALLLGMLPFWAGLAHFLYPELVTGARMHDGDGLPLQGGSMVEGLIAVSMRSRGLVLGLGGLVLVTSTVIGYLAWRRMSAAEAELALQDVVWEETRAEQRRIARWIAWGHLRASQREDGR